MRREEEEEEEGRMAAGGHSRPHGEERPEAKISPEAARAQGQQPESSNPYFSKLVDLLQQYIIFHMSRFIRKTKQPFVRPLAEL